MIGFSDFDLWNCRRIITLQSVAKSTFAEIMRFRHFRKGCRSVRPLDIVRENLPLRYRRTLAVLLRDAYARADEESRRLFTDMGVRSDHYPWIRRGLLEDALLVSPEGFEGIQSIQIPSRYFWHHVEIRSGQTILTLANHYDPEMPLRRSEFRDAMFRQMEMFSFDEVVDESKVPAVLLHHRLDTDHKKVGYAVIRCGRPNNDGWFEGGINLMHDHPDVFGLGRGENVGDDAFPEPLDDEETGT
jgi:hypothetical protein